MGMHLLGGRMIRKAILLLILVLLTAKVMALGITPGRMTFDYEPGLEKKVDFSVVNNEKKDVQFVILVNGEFNQSISLSEVSFTMSANEESKALSYTLKMPQDLSPGLHTTEIQVLQLGEKSSSCDSFVGGLVGVATQLYVNVPYPGKYAEGELNIVAEDSGKITFAMPIINRGGLDLVRVKGVVDIYSSLNEKITSVNTNEISLSSKERNEIAATWDSSKALPGPYRAVVSVLYDERVLALEKEFNVGTKKLKVEDLAVNDFSLGDIAKFEILVENTWSERITDVYAEMVVYNEDREKMAEFKSADYDIGPLSKGLIVAFWDTKGVKEGTYDSSLFLKYGENSEQRDLKLDISDTTINIIGFGYTLRASSKDEEGLLSTTNILIGAIVLLIIINLAWFTFLRKKFVKKK